MTIYADAGVNRDLGDDVSRILYNAAKLTWDNRKGRLGELIVPFDDFSGVRAIDVSGLPKGTLMNIGFDGVGTKMELAERVRDHRTIAYDLFAMVCDDAVVRGAEPVLVGSILDVNSLGSDEGAFLGEIKQLAEGYVGAAKAANVAIVNGEVAELGNRVGGYGKFNYNWGAAVVWFANRDRLFTGREIQEGDYLVGLREAGFRSNGLSSVRMIMRKHHGEEWHQVPWKTGSKSLADYALTPSTIYTAAVVAMFGGYGQQPKAEVHGVAHITGGGIPGKLGRILKPSGLGATVDNPFEPAEFMRYTQALGNVPDGEAYKTWNMGQGMIIITPRPDAVMEVTRDYGVESKVIGKITLQSGIRIANNGVYASEQAELIF
ncbi:MAG TPA: AIR synthase-related protein [Candidatus Nanoarchaeia archaeon]|nr:AIR synthase-related protein [Candidatus Nanoarchaeia archaeon]